MFCLVLFMIICLSRVCFLLSSFDVCCFGVGVFCRCCVLCLLLFALFLCLVIVACVVIASFVGVGSVS